MDALTGAPGSAFDQEAREQQRLRDEEARVRQERRAARLELLKKELLDAYRSPETTAKSLVQMSLSEQVCTKPADMARGRAFEWKGLPAPLEQSLRDLDLSPRVYLHQVPSKGGGGNVDLGFVATEVDADFACKEGVDPEPKLLMTCRDVGPDSGPSPAQCDIKQ